MSTPVQLDGRFVNWMSRLNAGEASLPNCEGSRHHYVPQCLLKRFRGGGKLYELDKQTGEAKETTTKEAAWDKDLYKVVSKSGDHDGVIEGFFSLAEGFASEALDGLVRDGESLTEHDRSDLAFLAAIQEQRAPGFLDELKIMLRHAALTESVVHLTNVKGKRQREAVETRDAILAGRIMLEPPDQEALLQATQLLVATWLTISILPWMYGPSKDILERLQERADEAPKPIRKRPVILEDADRADPAAADRNAARGWPRYIPDPSGKSDRLMSYEVIDTDDDARRSMSPPSR